MTANSLIDLALEEIAREYQPGTLPWMKANRPIEWGKMLTLEGKLNEMVLDGDQDGLRGVLDEYQGLILIMVTEFITLEEVKEQGSFNFVERPKSHQGRGIIS